MAIVPRGNGETLTRPPGRMCQRREDRSGSIAIAIAETLSPFGGRAHVDDIEVVGRTNTTRYPAPSSTDRHEARQGRRASFTARAQPPTSSRTSSVAAPRKAVVRRSPGTRQRRPTANARATESFAGPARPARCGRSSTQRPPLWRRRTRDSAPARARTGYLGFRCATRRGPQRARTAADDKTQQLCRRRAKRMDWFDRLALTPRPIPVHRSPRPTAGVRSAARPGLVRPRVACRSPFPDPARIRPRPCRPRRQIIENELSASASAGR